LATIYMQLIPVVKGKNAPGQPPEISALKRFSFLGEDYPTFYHEPGGILL
jgi:hypothetical protein